jgi:hypothetical protein
MEENLWPLEQDKEETSVINPLTMEIRKTFSLVMARGDWSKVRATEEAQFISSSTANLDQGVFKEVRGPAAVTLGLPTSNPSKLVLCCTNTSTPPVLINSNKGALSMLFQT